MGCGYISGKEHSFGLILLRKAYEAALGAGTIWKIELGEPLTEKEKAGLVKLLIQPGLEKKIRDEFNWLKFEDPEPSKVNPEMLFSKKPERKDIREAKHYLTRLSTHYMYASENYR